MTMMFGDKEPNSVGGPQKRSLLDGIISGLFGHSTAEMTPEEGAAEERADEAIKKKASAMAVQASESPGDAFMGPPVVSSGTDLLKDILKMFAGGGGGGGGGAG